MQARWSAKPRSFGKCEPAWTIRFPQTQAWCGWCRWCMYCVQRQNRKCFVRALDTGTYHHLLCARAWITITNAQADSAIVVSSVVGWTCQSPSWCWIWPSPSTGCSVSVPHLHVGVFGPGWPIRQGPSRTFFFHISDLNELMFWSVHPFLFFVKF